MQLRTARLCLDCEEVHDGQTCPVCASETFVYLMRWVPVPERRQKPRPATSPDAEVYRHLVADKPAPSLTGRLLKPSVLGLTAVGLAGWFWRRSQEKSRAGATDAVE